VRRKYARRRQFGRARNVLWRHASVNLVQPRIFAPAAAPFSGERRRSNFG
jgi:hypothetical protein